MKNKIIKNLKLGLVGIVLAGNLNGCMNKDTQNLEILKSKTTENISKFEKDSADLKGVYSSNKLYSDTLKINLNDRIYYITKKDEKSGIEDIRKINNGYEEDWLYFPEKQIWYEDGICSDSFSTKPSLLKIGEALKENPDARKLIFYHNHPREGWDKPSNTDLEYLVYQIFCYPEYKITGKIIAKEGVVEYSLNSNIRKLLEDGQIIEVDGSIKFSMFGDISKYFDISLKEYGK